MEAEAYISGKGFAERTLKLVAGVAKRRDVPDLKTGLLLANTQAVRRIMEGTTIFARRLFLTPDDWKQCEDLPIPCRVLFVDELYSAGVQLNFGWRNLSRSSPWFLFSFYLMQLKITMRA